MRSDIENRNHENPNDIHKMPIHCYHVKGAVRRLQSRRISWQNQHIGKDQESRDQMGRVERCDGVENRSVGVGVGRQMFPVRAVLKGLKREEYQAYQNGEGEGYASDTITLLLNLEFAPVQDQAAYDQEDQHGNREV